MVEETDILIAKIKEQNDKVRALKIQKADKALIDAETIVLNDLKGQLAALKAEQTAGGEEGAADKGKKKEAKESFTLKTPKGTKDYNDKEMAIREKVFSTITTVFKRHGAVAIDTPVFELKEILSGKYGDDSKLIYDLKDQGGEECSLRYDLTVPFARFLAMNGKEYQNFKRYHIAKVYRRDQPAMTKGRMREFYQCDFDIAGNYDPMVADAEILRIVCEALTALDLGKYTIKINHRKILDGIFEICGVPADKIRSISSAVDKLDKVGPSHPSFFSFSSLHFISDSLGPAQLPWEDVRKEMTEEKGLTPASADAIGEYVKFKGGRDLLERLVTDSKLMENESIKKGLEDMELLFTYLEVLGVMDKMSFDLSLARGLDYYTGIIYEAVTEKSAPPKLAEGQKPSTKKDTDELDESTVGVGSIAAGGRYDDLVGMFSGKNKKGEANLKIPCVGVSIGVERIFSILLAKHRIEEIKSNEAEVLVVVAYGGLLEERMKIATELWDAGIKAEYLFKVKPKLQPQWDACDKHQIPLAVILGPDELARGEVRIKDMRAKDNTQGPGDIVQLTNVVQEVQKRLAAARAPKTPARNLPTRVPPQVPDPSEFPELKNDLILRAARGEKVERTPIWIMRQAGRYLPEFRALRVEHDFFSICRTPELACKLTLQPIDRYGELLDAAIIFSDILVIPQALGMEVEMIPGKGPSFPSPLDKPADLARLLNEVDVAASLGYVYEAITMTRKALDGRVPLLGFIGAPWTLMAYMIEGGGSKNLSKAKAWLFDYPEESHRLLQKITDVAVEFLVGQIKAGAQMVQVFESWGGELGPSDFTTFALPYIRQISSRVKESLIAQSFSPVPMTIFAKGSWYALDQLASSNYEVISLDWTVPPKYAQSVVGDRVTLQGNMDPNRLFAGAEAVSVAATEMVRAFGREARYIANLGHGIMPGVDPDILKVYLETVRDVSLEIRKD
ncbi:Uroporphyrinogen decarboxylase-domain-containing protein [Endogone sp. FLAS-F59071]|nr:Uroporphyrinogen decarboxylase-domain-containing protein [Endogone sp. FLAS-F59071]|eukprot:RUS22635.1 Uroporphyrinogen decarboxylase-domain-containing protein [Endogone sp. FLAS-F59071]